MGSVIGQFLGNAVGVAISPVPIIAVILMLFSRAARRNSVAFLIGWLVALAAVASVVVLLGLGGSGGDADSGGWMKVVLGVLLLLLGLKQFRERPASGEEPEMPSWMSTIDDFSAAKALGMGALFAGVNPKNLALTLAAATTIVAADVSSGQEVATILVYVAIASITIIVPVIGYLVAGDRAEPLLTSMKEWLAANNAVVMTILFVVFGAKLLGDGIALVA